MDSTDVGPLGRTSCQSPMLSAGAASIINRLTPPLGQLPHAASSGDPSFGMVNPDEDVASLEAEEMDMFDIELQREFQVPRPQPASSLGGGGGNSSTVAGSRNAFSSISRGGNVSGGGTLLRSTGLGGATPPLAAAPTGADTFAAKQFSSVAGVCQVSTFAQDHDESARLVQLLAGELRREMGISNMARGDASNVFEEDLRLVTMVVNEINQRHHHHPTSHFHQQSPATGLPTLGVTGSTAGLGHTSAATGSRGAPSSTSPVGGPMHGTAVTGPNHLPGTVPTHHRTSPAGAGKKDAYNNGRSTIDREVSDSLGRISGTNPPHAQYSEYERPMNPYPGMPHPTTTVAHSLSRQPLSPGQYYYGAAPGAAAAAAAAQPFHPTASHARGAQVHGGGAKPSNSNQRRSGAVQSGSDNNRSPAGASMVVVVEAGSTVVHPRPVKPQPGVKGRSRGPRSQTGKNVAPSNRSAFSECSGGETRSYHSNLTAFHQNLSSTDITTNTSLSSTMIRTSGSAAVIGGGGGGGAGNGVLVDKE